MTWDIAGMCFGYGLVVWDNTGIRNDMDWLWAQVVDVGGRYSVISWTTCEFNTKS